MFFITAETCRKFTFAEILIMAAMNVLANASQSSASAKAGGNYGMRKY
jgi:hypothetical protein